MSSELSAVATKAAACAPATCTAPGATADRPSGMAPKGTPSSVSIPSVFKPPFLMDCCLTNSAFGTLSGSTRDAREASAQRRVRPGCIVSDEVEVKTIR